MGVMDEWTSKTANAREEGERGAELDRVGEAVAELKDHGFDFQDRVTMLLQLARFGSNMARTKRALAHEHGLLVETKMLRELRDSEDYEAFRKQFGMIMELRLVDEARSNAYAAANAERLAIEQAVARMEKDASSQSPRLGAAELAGIANSMASIKAKNVDKFMAMTGRPTQITEHRDAGQIIEALVRKGVLKDSVDSTATEVSAEQATLSP